ncbi:MAG: DUF192 domain-containing protein [Thiotrichales bacterium]|nr:DUF192 domain-containing protein [Thiotrichales bacterium]
MKNILPIQKVTINSGIRYRIISCLYVFFLALPSYADSRSLVIETAAAGKIRFNIELADTLEKQQAGLMFRDYLSPESGMLFYYRQPRHVSFWMKNTRIPLDILFINEYGEIVKIHRNAEPESLERILSGQKVLGVLEINGGMSDTLSIKEGDRVAHVLFNTQVRQPSD